MFITWSLTKFGTFSAIITSRILFAHFSLPSLFETPMMHVLVHLMVFYRSLRLCLRLSVSQSQ